VSVEMLSEFGATSEYGLQPSIPISEQSSVEYALPGGYGLSCTLIGYIIFFSFIL